MYEFPHPDQPLSESVYKMNICFQRPKGLRMPNIVLTRGIDMEFRFIIQSYYVVGVCK